MSVGLPVIAANVGGLGGIVAAAGFLFALGDARGLAAQLQHLLNDQTLSKEVGEKARKLSVAKYDWRVMAEHYCSLFIEFIETKS